MITHWVLLCTGKYTVKFVRNAILTTNYFAPKLTVVDSVTFSEPVTANITRIVGLPYFFNQTIIFPLFALVQLLYI